MIGLGTLINSIAIILGGLLGRFVGKFFKEEQHSSNTCNCSGVFAMGILK